MDGLLVVDKPSGPTSHDVVARIRRLLQERRIGHTGTLDPMASGVLPLLIGRATRLARFMSSEEKRYDATLRLGVATDTRDAMGSAIGTTWSGPWPDRDAIERALAPFRGTFKQQPPAFSAKKVAGQRSYRIARARARAGPLGAILADGADAEAGAAGPLLPAPAEVTAFAIELIAVDGNSVRLELACSSGFYVRSLAHDLGQALGVGAHLVALRRTATSGVGLSDAARLDDLQADGTDAARLRVIPLERLLPELLAVELTEAGAEQVTRGRDLSPIDARSGFPLDQAAPGPFRLITPAGSLMAIADRTKSAGLLHPAVVLV